MLPCLLPFEFPPLPPLLTSHYVALIKQLIPLLYLLCFFFVFFLWTSPLSAIQQLAARETATGIVQWNSGILRDDASSIRTSTR